MKLRARLLFVSIALILIFVFVADSILSATLDSYLTRGIREDLFTRLGLIERDAAIATPPLADLRAWDRLADELGARARARVTIIRADGVVIGDSDVDVAELAAVENHTGRPEVVAAMAGGRGDAVRDSATVGKRMLYAALPFERDGRVAGVVRAALPLTSVDEALGGARWLLLAASIVALAVAALVTWMATRRIIRDVGQLTDTAERMASGDLTARTRMVGADELGALGRTLDHLAAGLTQTLGELKSERDLAASILAAMQEGLLVLDVEGRIAAVNPALREMLLLPADVPGKRPLEVIRHHELKELIERGAGSGEIELSGVKPRRLLVRVSRLGGLGGKLVVFFDVTDLRRLESIRRDFVANVSHELRTPVTAVRSAGETLRAVVGKGDEATASRFLDIIERNAERLQDLVEDLLDLSRIESRQYNLRPELLDLGPALAHALLGLRERAEKKGIALKSEASPDVPPARADRRALEQVLANLIDNAIKYCGQGATVVARAAVHGDDIEVAVVDDGPGIEPNHLPRLFERFYRVDAGRGRDSGGTGLGLSIVKHLVEAMGGRVTVASVPGRGSTFSFTLPRAAPADSLVSASSPGR